MLAGKAFHTPQMFNSGRNYHLESTVRANESPCPLSALPRDVCAFILQKGPSRQ